MIKNNETPASLIILDMVGLVLTDLNKEIHNKISELNQISSDAKFLHFKTDGENHKISFLNEVIWDSELEKKYENITPEEEMKLNERPVFESHLRRLINYKLNLYRNLEL